MTVLALAGTSPALAQTVQAPIPVGSAATAIAINPVTNKIYVANDVANNLSVIDGSTRGVTTAATGPGTNPRPYWLAVNPETNKIYVGNFGTSNLSVLHGDLDNVSTTLATGGVGWTAINPFTNKAYVVRYGAGDEFSIIHDETYVNTAAHRSYQPVGIALNPVTNVAYLPNLATGDVVAVDVSVDALYPTLLCPNGSGGFKPSPGQFDPDPGPCINVADPPVAVAVNPVTDRVYAVSSAPGLQIAVINGITRSSPSAIAQTVGPTGISGAAKGIAVNPVTNKIYFAFADGIVALNGADNTYTVIPAGSAAGGPVAVGLNATTNKIYVPSADGTLVVIDGDTNAVSATLTIPAGAKAIAVNPVTNKAYVLSPSGVTQIDGAASDTTHSIPVTTTVTALAGNTSPASGSITLNATSTMAPAGLSTVRKVYYQIDGTNGAWRAATGSGPYTASFSGLSEGSHTIYAFATNGLDAPSIMTDVQNNPIVGNLVSYTFTVSATSKATPTVSLGSSKNPSSSGESITFTAAVAGSAGTATGSATFRDGATAIAGCSNVALASGTAACATASLGIGSHSITASYSGDSSYAAASSAALTQTVQEAAGSAPAAPVMGTATAGAGQVSVTFTPGSLNGGTLTHHHVTCTSASATVAYNGYGSNSPIVVSGLTSGTAYRCWARTVTNLGTSAWSGASNWATPMGSSPPAAPIMGTATAGPAQLSVTFTPGSLNGGTLTHHHVTCAAASGPAYNGYGSASPIVVNGLTAGTPYRCWARTVTNLGTSAWSGASNWATPTSGQPVAPQMGTATEGPAQVTVTFTPGSLNGGTLTHHHVTCAASSGPAYNGYGSASPIVVSGLTAGTPYRCWARTVTNLGTSAWSGASNWATPTNGPPAAPAMGSATPGAAQVSVSFTPGSLNGGTLTHHHVTCAAASGPAYNGYGSASPIVVSGLTPGTPYRCWARTVTNLGTGAWSGASNWATPTS